NLPIPNYIKTAVEFVINQDMKNILLADDEMDINQLQHLSDEARKWGAELEKPALGLLAGQRINSLMEDLLTDPENLQLLNEIEISISTFNELEIPLDVWKAQNILFMIHEENYERIKKQADEEDEHSQKWLENRKSTRLNSSHVKISYAVFCLKKKTRK